MARPRQHAPDTLHAKVMAMCDERLGVQSIHQLSLRALARDVGCAPSTLLKLYGSFGNLLQHVNIETLDIMRGQLADVKLASPDARLAALAQGYWVFAREHPYRWQLLFDHPLAQEGELDQRQNDAIDALFQRAQAILKEVNPALDDIHLSRIARTLWGSLHGLVQLGLNERLGEWNGQSFEVPELIGQLLDMTLAGLRAKTA